MFLQKYPFQLFALSVFPIDVLTMTLFYCCSKLLSMVGLLGLLSRYIASLSYRVLIIRYALHNELYMAFVKSPILGEHLDSL